jgi:hypothetical protein
MNDVVSQTPSELPGIVTSAVEQVLENPRALGLSWSLRMATVLGTTPLVVVYDGDTEVVNAISMIGPLAQGARCYVILVPPSGNFVVGTINVTIGYLGANVTNTGTGATTPVGGAETAVASATWASEPTYSFDDDTIYKATLTGFLIESTGAGGAVSFLRIRKGSATTSGTQLGLVELFSPAGFGGLTMSYSHTLYFKNSSGSTVRTKLSLSINGVIGAGQWTITGDNTNVPLSLVIESVGSIFAFPGLKNVPTV